MNTVDSAAGRVAIGKAQRNKVSRMAHRDVHVNDRNFDPIQLLMRSVEGRLPQLLPIKYSRMSESPFAFFSRMLKNHS